MFPMSNNITRDRKINLQNSAVEYIRYETVKSREWLTSRSVLDEKIIYSLVACDHKVKSSPNEF